MKKIVPRNQGSPAWLTESQSTGCRILHKRFTLRGTMLEVWINAPHAGPKSS